MREVHRLKARFSQRGVSLTHATIVGAGRRDGIEASLKVIDVELSAHDLAFCDHAWDNLPRRPTADRSRR